MSAPNGPFAKVVAVVEIGAGNAYDRNKFKLACGHEIWGTQGAKRLRCWQCRVLADVRSLTAPEQAA